MNVCMVYQYVDMTVEETYQVCKSLISYYTYAAVSIALLTITWVA